MRRLLAPTLFTAMMLPSLAAAQLHGTHESTERQREPGIRPNTLEALIVSALEKSHNHDAWRQHEAVAFSMQLELNDGEPLKVQAIFATDGPQCIVTVNGKPMLGHDGENAWVSPEAASLGDAQVHVRMLGQLQALPYRLRGEDVILRSGPMRSINERRYYAATHEPVEGDDWSILLVDPQSDLLHLVAYFIRTTEQCEPAFSPAYAMVATDYRKADEVPVARTWHIWNWSRPRGPVGDEPIGTVRVVQVRFMDKDEQLFRRPESRPAVDDCGDGA